MGKRSKHPKYDDPTAFGQCWPRIVEVTDGSVASPLGVFVPVRYFKMGKCRVALHEADEQMGWFMSVQRNDRYPSWDEIVWLRYNLIPDAALMMLKLPNLNSYINQEDTNHRNVFTMEQAGWLLDPQPTCPDCGETLSIDPATQTPVSATFVCQNGCDSVVEVDFNHWNETHGNGAATNHNRID